MINPEAQPERTPLWLPDQEGPDPLDSVNLGFRLLNLDAVLQEAGAIGAPENRRSLENDVTTYRGFTVQAGTDGPDKRMGLTFLRGDVPDGRIYVVKEDSMQTFRRAGKQFDTHARFTYTLYVKSGQRQPALDHDKSMYQAAYIPGRSPILSQFIFGSDIQMRIFATENDLSKITDSRLDEIQELVDMARGALRSRLTS